jgi:L-threonylcarbamoyladenylate synthase
LDGGGVAVVPTDTVYGLAARLDRASAITRIFDLKRRPISKALPVLVPSVEAATRLGVFWPDALRMASEGWPGPLTLVVEASSPLPQVGGDGSTVGLRVPDHSFTLELLRRCGPLAATSANRSGMATGSTVDQVMAEFGDGVDLYIDGGLLAAAPSKVISLVGDHKRLR